MDKKEKEFRDEVDKYSAKISEAFIELNTNAQNEHADYELHVEASIYVLKHFLELYFSETANQKLKSKVLDDLMHHIYEE